MLDTDTLTRLFRGLATEAAWGVTLFELLLIGVCVNWCAGVLQGTRGTRPLRGLLIVLVVATLIVQVLSARMGWDRLELLYNYFVIGLAFIALVAFQPELRRAFIRAGDVRFLRRGTPQSKVIAALVKAAGYLSRNRYGALIAIERSVDLRGWAENGTLINAEVTSNLLNTVFFPNSPLHDLGVIIKGHRVLAANCQFPQADSDEVDAALGSRHLAAVAMSYESDALVLVVSEETGTISLADNGKLTRFLSLEELADELSTRLSGQQTQRTARAGGHHRFSGTWRIVRRTLVVVPLTLVIWFLAAQATQKDEQAELELTIRRPSPDLWIGQLEPPSLRREGDAPVIRFTATFRGSTRAIRQLRDDTVDGPLQVEWNLPPIYARTGPEPHTVPVRTELDNLPAVRERGLTIVDASPDTMSFLVDRLETVTLPAKEETGRTKVTDVRFEPAELSVTLPQQQLDGIPETDRHVTVHLEQRLRDELPGELVTFEDVPVELRIGDVRVVAIDPDRVSVTLRVVGQRTTVRLQNIPVNQVGSPQVFEQYLVERRDPNEWLIELEVEGDKSVVEGLRPQDVRALVQISGDIATPTTEFRSVEIEVLLPPGVKLVGPRRVVQLRVVAREAVTP